MRIFTFPRNYESGAMTYEANASFMQGDPAPQLSDGRDDTSNTNTHYLFDFGERQIVNAVFCEVFGFDSVSLQGGGITVTDHPINQASQARGTRHYSFTPFFDMNTRQVRLNFGGSGRVFRIALVRQLLNITNPEWTQIAHRTAGQDNQIRTNILGNSVVIESRAGRWKTQTDFVGFFRANANPSVEQILSTLENNANLFIYPLPDDQPTFFYPAGIIGTTSVNYVGRIFTQRELRFTIQEL